MVNVVPQWCQLWCQLCCYVPAVLLRASCGATRQLCCYVPAVVPLASRAVPDAGDMTSQSSPFQLSLSYFFRETTGSDPSSSQGAEVKLKMERLEGPGSD